MALDPTLRLAIWQRYEEERPRPGPELANWVERIAEEAGTTTAVVRRVMGECAQTMLMAATQKTMTSAQQIAEAMGANMVAALEVLREAFGATKKRPVMVKGAMKLVDPKLPPTSDNILWIEVPDWPSRLEAVRSIIEIFGARAPQQFEVKSQSVVMNLSPKDALAELQRLSVELPRLERAYREIAGAGEGGEGSGITIEGAVSG